MGKRIRHISILVLLPLFLQTHHIKEIDPLIAVVVFMANCSAESYSGFVQTMETKRLNGAVKYRQVRLTA